MEDERKCQRKLQEQRLVRLDLDTVNKSNMQRRQKDVQDILDRDIKMLDEFMKSEREEKESNFRRREELRRDMALYRANLSKEKECERQRQLDIEGYYSREMDRVNFC
jgi:hypothetical protein